jgi:TctA family transporter
VDSRTLGLVVIALGVGAIALGVLITTGAMSWFGRLPGDIRIENESTRVYVPITSMIVVSVVVTVIVNLLRRLF